MTIYHGVRPVILATSIDHDTALGEVESILISHRILKPSGQYIATSGSQMHQSGLTNMLQTVNVDRYGNIGSRFPSLFFWFGGRLKTGFRPFRMVLVFFQKRPVLRCPAAADGWRFTWHNTAVTPSETELQTASTSSKGSIMSL